jgi:hypothetical protein
MKGRLLFVITLLAVAAAPRVVTAQTKPNFTGTWKMNLEKSKSSDGKPITYYSEFTHEIEHQEPKLRIKETIKSAEGTRTVDWNVTTDGKEYDTKVEASPAKVSARWDGDRLVQRIQWTENGGEFRVTRTSTLSTDGRTITADWEFTDASGGQVRATEIWEKQ